MSLKKWVFMNSPFIIKRILANIEAIRRDKFRYSRNIKPIDEFDSLNSMMSKDWPHNQNKIMESILEYATLHVPAYKKYIGKDLFSFPLLNKTQLRKNYFSYLSDEINIKDCFVGRTSGSTGTPLKYYKHKVLETYNYYYADLFFKHIGCNSDTKKIRFSGVNIIPFDKENAPFWIYIKRYKQLQCSSYHINEKTFVKYYKKINKFVDKNTIGTGYPTAWLFLAELIEKFNLPKIKLKAIVSDSEGISSKQQNLISNVFMCPVYQTYGLSEIGQIAVQCNYGNYHIIPSLAYIETIPFDETFLSENEIVVTTLKGKMAPLIRYRTGDIGELSTQDCKCGLKSQVLSKIIGRIDDYLFIKGRKIGRVSQILKVDKGVIASQIIQKSTNNILIKIIPDENFSQNTIDFLKKNAYEYLGDVEVNIEITTELIRNNNGKIRYVIREIN